MEIIGRGRRRQCQKPQQDNSRPRPPSYCSPWFSWTLTLDMAVIAVPCCVLERDDCRHTVMYNTVALHPVRRKNHSRIGRRCLAEPKRSCSPRCGFGAESLHVCLFTVVWLSRSTVLHVPVVHVPTRISSLGRSFVRLLHTPVWSRINAGTKKKMVRRRRHETK
jgi:hypothetical protein